MIYGVTNKKGVPDKKTSDTPFFILNVEDY